jgi:hypothetical protein
VTARPGFGGEARVEIRAGEGPARACEVDITMAEANLDVQRQVLQRKFERLVGPVLGHRRADQAASTSASLHELEDVANLLALCRLGGARRPRTDQSEAMASGDVPSVAVRAGAVRGHQSPR